MKDLGPLRLHQEFRTAFVTDADGIEHLPVDTLRMWLNQTADNDPYVGLAAIGLLRRFLLDREWHLVQKGRQEGMSWHGLATELGRSKQSVWEKYSNPADPSDQLGG